MARVEKLVRLDDVVCLLKEEMEYWEAAELESSLVAMGALANCLVTLMGLKCCPHHSAITLIETDVAPKVEEAAVDVSPGVNADGSSWYRPHLVDCADGVRGHYCIGRNGHAGYAEFWSEGRGWCSAGTVYIGKQNAMAKLRELNGAVDG